VVEHSLGKGEVVSSILTGSTSQYFKWFELGREKLIVTANARTWPLHPCEIRAFCSLSVHPSVIDADTLSLHAVDRAADRVALTQIIKRR
jgi:hypothetical protein